MEQARPTMSQSPLRMHSVQNSGSTNNFSQKQLGTLPNGGNSGAAANNRSNNYGASPIRESLIKNTGAFILGNNATSSNTGGQSQPGQAGVAGQTITQQTSHNNSSQGNLNNFGPSDVAKMGVSPNKRDRSTEQDKFEFADRALVQDMSRTNAANNNHGAGGPSFQNGAKAEKDALDNFMSLPEQQQAQIQMLTEQQQMAYITQHRAETSGVRMHSNQNHFNQLNSVTFRGMPPSSGGTGTAQIAYNPLHSHQQQSSQPILNTASKYGVGPPQQMNQARQSQVPQFTGITVGSGIHGDSGSFAMPRNQPNGGLLSTKDKAMNLSNSPKQETIKNKRVFIDNTMDSILQSKSSKTSSFMNKPVGAMSGTGTTEVHPKVHSVSPRGNVGSSIVGLPNVVMGSGQAGAATANITKKNVSGGASPTNDGQQQQSPMFESQAQQQRAADASRQVDDFLAETDKLLS